MKRKWGHDSMIMFLLLLIAICIFVILFFSIKHIKFDRIKSIAFEININSILEESETFSNSYGFLNSIQHLIDKSNIRFYLKFYNVYVHLAITGVCLITFFKSDFLMGGLIIQISFAFVGATLPFIVLNIISSVMQEKVKKQSIVFLTGLKNYYMTYHDIFKAFEMLTLILPQPLASYTQVVHMKYKAKLSPIKCLSDFRRNVGSHSNLGLFTDNLIVSLVEGTDLELLIDEYVRDIEMLSEEEDQSKADQKFAHIMIYLFVLLLFLAIRSIHNMPDFEFVTSLFWHQLATLLAIFTSIWIIIKTLRRD